MFDFSCVIYNQHDIILNAVLNKDLSIYLIIGHVNHEVHYSYMVGMIGIVPTHSECTEIDKKGVAVC